MFVQALSNLTKNQIILVVDLAVVDLEVQFSINTVQAPGRSAREAVRRKQFQALSEPFLQRGEIFMLELDGKVLQPAVSPIWVEALWRDVRVVIIVPAGGIAAEVAQDIVSSPMFHVWEFNPDACISLIPKLNSRFDSRQTVRDALLRKELSPAVGATIGSLWPWSLFCNWHTFRKRSKPLFYTWFSKNVVAW